MINFLHTYIPNNILITFGPINIYWYGVFIVCGILAGILITLKLAQYYHIAKTVIIDFVFWLVLGGVIGARLYHVALEWPYYLVNPLDIFKVWHGGLAIHGAIIGGILITWLLAKKNKLNFWLLTAIFTPGLALAQAVGRWGNYFNQELFGKPTDLPWGIPILPSERIINYYNSQYFHPTFLYDSLGSFLIFFVLIFIHIRIIKKKKVTYKYILIGYLTMYSLLRFLIEFLRTDVTITFLGLRFPQIISLLIIFIIILYFLLPKFKKRATIQ